jgi:dTDP-4-dehydrorhamnose 3,5-epimerase
MINGVEIKPLKRIMDERGMIMHMLRRDDPLFEEFGEIYFSVIFPGAIKAWHRHKKMELNYAVVSGNIKLVLWDGRKGSPTLRQTQEIFLGEDNYVLVKVPPGVVNGFVAIGNERAIVANCATMPHDPAEIERLDPLDREIGYTWDRKYG